MGVYIKGMEMPQAPERCRAYMDFRIWHDGTVEARIGPKETEYKAVSVPQHGRLIDADALTVKLQRHREYHSDESKSGAAISNGIGQCLDIINGKECPTIIPAEEGET